MVLLMAVLGAALLSYKVRFDRATADAVAYQERADVLSGAMCGVEQSLVKVWENRDVCPERQAGCVCPRGDVR